jgi:hypothetical protein
MQECQSGVEVLSHSRYIPCNPCAGPGKIDREQDLFHTGTEDSFLLSIRSSAPHFQQSWHERKNHRTQYNLGKSERDQSAEDRKKFPFRRSTRACSTSQIHGSTVPRLLWNCAGPYLGIVKISFSLGSAAGQGPSGAEFGRRFRFGRPRNCFVLISLDLDAEPEWKATLAPLQQRPPGAMVIVYSRYQTNAAG